MMKKINTINLIILITILFSCTEEVKLDLKTAPPRLVIDASIEWIKETDGKDQKIILSKSTGFYDKNINFVSNADINITTDKNETFLFKEDSLEKGTYICNNFKPEYNQKYFLNITAENQRYKSEYKLLNAPDITNVVQENNQGLSQNQTQIKAYFNDFQEKNNYYIMKFDDNIITNPEYNLIEDTFFNGNLGVGFFLADENTIPGKDHINIKLYQIDKQHYDFFSILLNQVGTGNPFSATPSNARGNIQNITNPQENPYGYFNVNEVSQENYLITK